MRRLYVLLTWHPALGLPAAPGGVLGAETTAGGRSTVHVSWIPDQAGITTLPWRSRLATQPSMAMITAWLDGDGTWQLAEIPAPDDAFTPRDAVELTLDMLVAEVLPLLPLTGSG